MAWQIGQPWLEGGMLIGSGRKSVLIEKDVLPSWGMCHSFGGCITHLGVTSPTQRSRHPPGARITYLEDISPTWGVYHPHRGHITLPVVTSPTCRMCHTPGAHITHPGDMPPTWGSHHPPRGRATQWVPSASCRADSQHHEPKLPQSCCGASERNRDKTKPKCL